MFLQRFPGSFVQMKTNEKQPCGFVSSPERLLPAAEITLQRAPNWPTRSTPKLAAKSVHKQG